MPEHGKRYKTVIDLIEKSKSYEATEAVVLLKKMATAKFDETVELHIRLGLDPKNSQQQVRGVALLPHGLGKSVRIAVFAQGEAQRIAEQAGADFAGGDDLIKKIEDGWTDFDVSIAVPELMGKVGKLGKILGRKGLMPNPKSGTVVGPDDLPRAISDARKGRVEFKLDRAAIIHVPIGKASFDESKLVDNLTAVIDAIVRAKPAGAKGQYIKSANINSTMGPGIALDLRIVLTAKAA
ncbi:50S ribosomal protein L1 [Chloroflexota bacterium]